MPTAIQNGITNGKNNSIVLSTDEAESQLTDFIEKVKAGGMSAEEMKVRQFSKVMPQALTTPL